MPHPTELLRSRYGEGNLVLSFMLFFLAAGIAEGAGEAGEDK